MKTVRLFLQTANLTKNGTKILVSSENRMEDNDIEDILEEGVAQKSDDLITLKINTIKEDTGIETMDLVVLFGVLKSRLTGDVQAALFAKLGDFYKEGFPKIKTEAETWGEKMSDRIIASSTIDEYEKQIQFLVPDDYDDSDETTDEDEEEETASDVSEDGEEADNKTKILAVVGSVVIAFGLFLGYQMLKPAEPAVAKEKDKQVTQSSQQKNNNSNSSSSKNNKSNSKNKKKPSQAEASAEPENSDATELNPEEKADSNGASSGSGVGSNEHGSASSGVSLNAAMSELSEDQKNSIAVAFGLPKDGKQNASEITKKRQGLKNIGEALEKFTSPKRRQSFLACWKKFYPNDRLDFDLYLLEKAYNGSSYKLESVDWTKPAFTSADIGVIREVDKLFSGSASSLAEYINVNDSEELALLNDINSVKSLNDLGEVFRKKKCAELFATRMTIENLKSSLEYNLNPSNSGSRIPDEIHSKFTDFRNKKENMNLNNRQLMEAFVNDLLREARNESNSVALIHSDFRRIIEAIKAAAD